VVTKLNERGNEMAEIITLEYKNELVIKECPSCGITYAMPIRFDEEKRKTHGTFYCPKGHNLYYPTESEEEKYKRLYETKKQCCDRKGEEIKYLRNRFNGFKGYVAKIKKQIQTTN